jgi:thymidylate kinase
MFIAFAGLPSSGKSSTARALARLVGVNPMLEPEEPDWPSLVRDRAITGAFTALTWFRSVRVPFLFAAADTHRSGGIAIVDSYYDVLIARYLGSPPFNWLLSPTDPYFAAAKEMVEADWQNLPKASVLVFLRLNEQVWREFVSRRDRDLDRSARITEFFQMQELMEAACREAEADHATRLVIVDQRSSTPDETARAVAARIGIGE